MPDGDLYLNDGLAHNSTPNRGNVCVSGYRSGHNNYCLSNFYAPPGGITFNDPDIGNITFPTSEHYLHFQKLNPDAKHRAKDRWVQLSASQLLSGLRKLGSASYIAESDWKHKKANGRPDTDTWDDNKIYVQMQINATKYAQLPEFKHTIHKAIAIGKALDDGKGAVSIIEDTATASVAENLWGTGVDGRGTNILGNSQTAFANMVLNQYFPSEGPPPLADFLGDDNAKSTYSDAQKQYQTFQQTLVAVRAKNPGKIDTGDIAGVRDISAEELRNYFTYSNKKNQRISTKADGSLKLEFRRETTAPWEEPKDDRGRGRFALRLINKHLSSTAQHTTQSEPTVNLLHTKSVSIASNGELVLKTSPLLSTNWTEVIAADALKDFFDVINEHLINNYNPVPKNILRYDNPYSNPLLSTSPHTVSQSSSSSSRPIADNDLPTAIYGQSTPNPLSHELISYIHHKLASLDDIVVNKDGDTILLFSNARERNEVCNELKAKGKIPHSDISPCEHDGKSALLLKCTNDVFVAALDSLLPNTPSHRPA